MSSVPSYFPDDTWATISPREAGWDEGALNEALDAAGDFNSSGVVMLKDGKLVVEQYWPAIDPDTLPAPLGGLAKNLVVGRTQEGYPLEDVASAQKSLVAVLAGIARDNGLIDYDDPVDKYLGPDWARVTGAQSAKINIRHLMTHTSGLTESLEYVAEPGIMWRYNTGAYQNLMRILSACSKLDANTLTCQWLTGAIGMDHTSWIERAWANQDPPMLGLVSTPRDLAKFGLLIMSRGRWADRQVVTARAVDEMLAPSQSLNPAYGLLWWLNGDDGYMTPAKAEFTAGRRVPSAPPDMVAAAGALNRYVFILPSDGIVIVRTGLVNPGAPGGNDGFDKAWWPRLAKVFGH